MNVIDLRERFGRRYRIEFDPAYDPKHRPRNTLDRWYMLIPAERGTIYPHGGTLLAAEVEGRAITRERLRRLDCTSVIQEGDDFLAVTFDVADFDRVAEIVRPRKRRRLTPEQRAASSERLRRFRYQSRTSGQTIDATTHS